MKDEILAIYEKHTFKANGTWYCSYDSVYEDLCDLFPRKNHKQICDLMEQYQ